MIEGVEKSEGLSDLQKEELKDAMKDDAFLGVMSKDKLKELSFTNPQLWMEWKGRELKMKQETAAVLTTNEEKRAMRIFNRMDSKNSGSVDCVHLASIAQHSDRKDIMKMQSQSGRSSITREEWRNLLTSKKVSGGVNGFSSFLSYAERTSAHFSEVFAEELAG